MTLLNPLPLKNAQTIPAEPLTYDGLLQQLPSTDAILIHTADEQRFDAWLRQYTEPDARHPMLLGIPIFTSPGCPHGRILLISAQRKAAIVLNLEETK